MRLLHNSRAAPMIIGLIFGGLWGVLGALALPAPWRIPAGLAAVLLSLALIARVQRSSLPPDIRPELFERRAYMAAVTLEIVAICAAGSVLPHLGLRSYFTEAVGIIVGLHFIGLWAASRSNRFLWIAACMCAVSALVMPLPAAVGEVSLRDAVAGLGNGLVLWIGTIWTVRRSTAAARP